MRQMLEEKTRAVNRLYGQLDRHISSFKRRSGIRCIPACGECCLKEDLSATVLEFLPAAHSLLLRGECDAVLDRINENTDTTCVFFNPFGKQGKCSVYGERGLICRLFGFSARTDKYGARTLVACSIIKDSMKHRDPALILAHAPNLSSYYLRLYGIDPELSVKYLPVNQAIKEAIELTLFRSSFRKRPA